MAIFTTTNYPINALIEDIDLGKIGLPELQRPFVWPNVKVRNLFDSLYRGYPAGFLLFWETGADEALKSIGTKSRDTVAKLALVDGQQRLTSLYAVLKGAEVVRKDFKRERIRIAFNPMEERFDVIDAAILKDKSYIPDISVIWHNETDIFELAENYIAGLSSTREINSDQSRQIRKAISKLQQLPAYQFVALTLAPSVGGDEIADVFVRINGEGKKLNQSDFIMTLMSVYWDEGRAQLEKFAREAAMPASGKTSPFNHFITPSPDQMLRVTVGLGLKRARLKNVYNVLRGRDAQTGVDDPIRRAAQFQHLKGAQEHALNLNNWHHFLSGLTLAGYRNARMISSQSALIFSYTIYLIGLKDYAIDRTLLRQAIAEFFFMAALTGRYTSSPETKFEADLGVLANLSNGDEFISRLREICDIELSSDYWDVRLPNQLATSAAQSPSLFAYQAALIGLDAFALYSRLKIANLADPSINGSKTALERHHLFPKDFLKSIGLSDTKQINQIANYAQIEWPENLKISNKSPQEYVPELDASLSGKDREEAYFLHALKPLWWELPYDEFLRDRRGRMAKVVQKAWEKLSDSRGLVEEVDVNYADLIDGGETDAVEFKSTLRTNLHTGEFDSRIENSALKTIAGFMNLNGGTLLIGVSDDGSVLGLEADRFPNEDKMSLHLLNLIRGRIGEVFLPYVHPMFDGPEGERILLARCERGPKPAFLSDGSQQKFYVRGGNATTELTGNAIVDFTQKRFR
jgi:hypothetical protein